METRSARRRNLSQKGNADKNGMITVKSDHYLNHWHDNHKADWFPWNPYLKSYQRGPTPDYKACCKSAFENNSEACNIWTHALSAILTLYWWILFLKLPSEEFANEWEEKIATSLMYFGMTVCFTFSTIFHLVYCHSVNVYECTLRMDLVGIILSVLGCYGPWLYYSFYHDSWSQKLHTCIILIVGVVGLFVALQKKYLREDKILYRIAATASVAIVSWGGFIEICYRDGFANAWEDGHKYYVYLFMWDAIAVFILACRLPERIISGKYDGWVHSHPLFHTLTFFSACCGYLFADAMRKKFLILHQTGSI